MWTNRVLQLDVYTIYAGVNLQFALKLLATMGAEGRGNKRESREDGVGAGREVSGLGAETLWLCLGFGSGSSSSS